MMLALIASSMGFANASPLTCAEGGTCVVGDTGPGGGIVFFVKSTGPLHAQASYSSLDTLLGHNFIDSGSRKSACLISSGCGQEVLSVDLTKDEQAALPWDYLEISTTALSTSVGWSSATTTDLFIDTRFGKGLDNSAAIISAFPSDNSSNNAAHLTANYSSNGLNDWWLPSMDEASLVLYTAYQHEQSGAPKTIDFPNCMWTSNSNWNSIGNGLSWQTYGGGPNHNFWQTLSVDRIAACDTYAVRGFSKAADTPSTTPASTTPASLTKKHTTHFAFSSSVLSVKAKSKLAKVAKSEKSSIVNIKVEVGRISGVPTAWMKNLAEYRGLTIKSYLVRKGLTASNISVSHKIIKQHKRPKTKVVFNP